MSFEIHDVWKVHGLSKMGQITLNAFLNLTNKTNISNSMLFHRTFPFFCSITFAKAQISKLIKEHKPFSVNI